MIINDNKINVLVYFIINISTKLIVSIFINIPKYSKIYL